ncbi:MAG: membrane-bound lytic murein transglycosylase MltF [Gammaproteobacteria bacterium]|nr:membrane-bound lytic murein transglycosylase MltF [Gammaproteobacteria bacterium]
MPVFLLGCILCLGLMACGPAPSMLEQVQQKNELIVISRNSATTYYEGPNGPTGFEYELAKRFADYLGVELHIVIPPNFNDILPLVALGDAHLAAAGLTATEKRREKVRFGPNYHQITPQLVYRSGSKRPRSAGDLQGTLEVVAGSSHEERLEELKQEFTELSWEAQPEQSSEELLTLVWQQLIDYTVADSHELAVNRHYYPELKPAFDLDEPQPLAWAFPNSEDNSLFLAAGAFFKQIMHDGTLEQLIERYFGHIETFDYVGTRRYQAHVEQRLPQYLELFTEAASGIGMDWRLLAAIGYQESHWDPGAVSPTGVRGLMMLTRNAAKDLGIENRSDPVQSIMGGAEYLARMAKRLPEHIPEPDRTWMALAAYNVGLGHLEDARKLTIKNKGDPDRWVDVKKNLPLLSKKKWFQQTRYGYARGREPVRYVQNIRTYYDILVWLTEQKVAENGQPPEPLRFDSPAL